MHNESHAARCRNRRLADILARMRHDGCGGQVGKAELLTGIEGTCSRPVRRIEGDAHVKACAAETNAVLQWPNLPGQALTVRDQSASRTIGC
jgi:hypothetical protein